MTDAERELVAVGRRQFTGMEGAKDVSFTPKISVNFSRLAFVSEFITEDPQKNMWARSVNFQTTETGDFVMSATDGTIMGRANHYEDYEWKTESPSVRLNRSVPVASFATILKEAAKSKEGYYHKARMMEISFGDDCAVFSFGGLSASGKYISDFPDLDYVIPKTGKEISRIVLNLDLLMKIRDAYDALNGKKRRETPLLRCDFSGMNSPVVHRDADNKLEIVFMPCISSK